MTTETAIPYLDLLGTPWETTDCRAVVRIAYERAGAPLPAVALESPDGGWEPAQRPLRPLDVIACGTEGAGVSHLAVVIRDKPRLLALTSGAGYGVSAVSVSAISGVVGVYRRRTPGESA